MTYIFLIVLTQNAVHNTAPEYFSDLIRFNGNGTTIRTRASFDPCILRVPTSSKMRANSSFERSFMYAASTLWNPFDLDIRLLTFDAFENNQDTSLSEVLCKFILIHLSIHSVT